MRTNAEVERPHELFGIAGEDGFMMISARSGSFCAKFQGLILATSYCSLWVRIALWTG